MPSIRDQTDWAKSDRTNKQARRRMEMARITHKELRTELYRSRHLGPVFPQQINLPFRTI